MNSLTVTSHRWASVEQTAEYAQVTTKTIRRYIAAGHLTGYRMGPRLLRVDLNEVDNLLRPLPTARGGGDAA